jgi:hypothetical protein
MKIQKISGLLVLVLFAFSFSQIARAARPSTALVSAVTKATKSGKMSADQDRIIHGIWGHISADDCDDILAGKAGRSSLADVPDWLVGAANDVFLKGRPLNQDAIWKLDQMAGNSKLITISADRSLPDTSALQAAVNKVYSASNNGNVTNRVSVTVAGVSKSGNYMALKTLLLRFDNGQMLELRFRKIPLGTGSIYEALQNLIVSAVNHREVLSNRENLAQEINAFNYNLKKLEGVGREDIQGKVNVLIRQLGKAFPGALVGAFRFESTIMGDAFATYLDAKQKMVALAQSLQPHEDPQPQKRAVLTADERDAAARARLFGTGQKTTPASGTTPQRSQPQTSPPSTRTISRDDGSNFYSTYLWITDPTYMFTHPWFWGARDNSFTGMWMMFDHMSAAQHQNTFNQQNMTYNDMNRFSQPVDPVFTTNPANPVIDPWAAGNIDPSTVVQRTEDHGVEWTTSSAPADRAAMIQEATAPSDDSPRAAMTQDSSSGSDSTWKTFTTEGDLNKAAPSPSNDDGWKGGADTSAPANNVERDSSIKGS